MYLVAHLTPYEWNLNFSCCTAHQPHPAAQYANVQNSFVQLSNNYSFWNTLWFIFFINIFYKVKIKLLYNFIIIIVKINIIFLGM